MLENGKRVEPFLGNKQEAGMKTRCYKVNLEKMTCKLDVVLCGWKIFGNSVVKLSVMEEHDIDLIPPPSHLKHKVPLSQGRLNQVLPVYCDFRIADLCKIMLVQIHLTTAHPPLIRVLLANRNLTSDSEYTLS